MESLRSRSESPFTRSKVKEHENGTENGKGKKIIKSKQKSQRNDLDSEDSRASEQEDVEERGNEADNDTNDSENKITNGNGISIENGHQEEEEIANNNGSINNCESSDAANGDHNQTDENEVTEETAMATRSDETPDLTNEEEPIITETENCAKNDTPEDALSQSSETLIGEGEKVSNGETDNVTQQEEDAEVGSTVRSSSEQPNTNGSDNGSHYEDAHSTKDDAQLSLDGTSLSSKLSSFWGKWNSPSQEEKRNLEVSSPKNAGMATINHPYLSKVSGRRGIRERLNSSATAFELKDDGRRTPENSEINFDDSFRVRTNPPRLNSTGILENPTLKKYKGKRCLNASDEPEEEEDVDVLSSKRRKLDKSEESGLLGGLLWSPFKKKPIERENELKLSATESKITRFLSPFWFWKKLAAGQK